MSTHNQRGRAPRSGPPASPMRIFYALLAVIAVGGVAVLATALLGGRQAVAPSGAAGTVAPADASIPTGKTADGLYSKGSDSAKVVVTEYSDYQ